METLPSASVTGAQTQQAVAGNAWSNLDLDQFIKMLVAELQNQDPLEPMDNSQILQQISQIRAIGSNDRMVDTLASVQLGQSMSTASSMIGRTVTGLSDDLERVTGLVDRVTIEEGIPKLHLGQYTIDLKNVSEILGESENEG